MADNKLQRTINSNPNPYTSAPTADSNITVASGQTFVRLQKAVAGDSTVTLPPTSVSKAGDEITVLMTDKAGGSGNYTLACLQGTVTFSAVGHVATFRYQPETGIGWTLTSDPFGATVA